MYGKFIGTGSYVPEKVLDNNELSQSIDTDDAWIRERTGIIKRHIAGAETVTSMAARAAVRALENSGYQADEIDLILVATSFSNVILPCTACEVQKEIGAHRATCFDLNAACTGFVFAVNTAQAYISSGAYQKALVIGVDALSHLVDWTDRGTCILFGDGAGAVVIEAQESACFAAVTHSDGAKGGILTCDTRDVDRQNAYINMKGQEVFKFAVRKVPEVIGEVLQKEGLTADDVDFFLLHQANRRIVEAAARKTGQSLSKFPMNMEEYGNTSSASIGILLDELNRKGALSRGQKIVIAGFGAGLSWGALLIRW